MNVFGVYIGCVVVIVSDVALVKAFCIAVRTLDDVENLGANAEQAVGSVPPEPDVQGGRSTQAPGHMLHIMSPQKVECSCMTIKNVLIGLEVVNYG